jgi:hypothetical protein
MFYESNNAGNVYVINFSLGTDRKSFVIQISFFDFKNNL